MTQRIGAPGTSPASLVATATRTAARGAADAAQPTASAGSRRAFSELLSMAVRSGGGIGGATALLGTRPGQSAAIPVFGSGVAGSMSAATRTAVQSALDAPKFASGATRSGTSAAGAAARTRGAAGGANVGAARGVPQEYERIVADAAQRYNVDAALLAGVIETESGFNPRAQSGAGAKGLMQLMDATARGLGVADSFDPVQNVQGGARFLREMLDRYQGDVSKALAAYNAGPGTVDRYGGIPPYAETQRYVPKVLAAAERYRGPAGTV